MSGELQTRDRNGVGTAVQYATRYGREWLGRIELSAGDLRNLAQALEDADERDRAIPELRALCDFVNELNGR